jgi:hypothetical protein
MATVAKKIVAKAKTAVASKVKAKVNARRPSRRLLTDDARLKVTNAVASYREGTAVAKMFEAVKSCKTVGEAKGKLGRFKKYGNHVERILRWWNKHGIVTITKPEAAK